MKHLQILEATNYIKLKSCPANPAYNNNTFYPKYKELFQKNEKAIKPFNFWVETIIGEVDMDLTEIHKKNHTRYSTLDPKHKLNIVNSIKTKLIH